MTMATLTPFPMTVRPAAALYELAQHEDAWSPDQQRHMNMRPYRDVHTIALRASIARLHCRFEDLKQTARTPDWERFPICARIAADLADILGAPLGRVAVIAIRPHGLILPHRLTGDYARAHVQCLVPVQTPASEITCGESSAALIAGECWTVDPTKTTSIRNLCSEWHIHLAADVAIRGPGSHAIATDTYASTP